MKKFNFNWKIKEKWSNNQKYTIHNLIFFILSTISLLLMICFPLFLTQQIIAGTIMCLIIIGLNFAISIGGRNAIYFVFWKSCLFWINHKKNIDSQDLFQSKKILEKENALAFSNNKNILFKAYFVVSNKRLSALSDYEIGNLINSFNELILKNRELRIFSLNLDYDVDSNIDFINKRIKENFDFNVSKEEFINNHNNKFLMKQALEFEKIANSTIQQKISILEYSQIIPFGEDKYYLENALNEFLVESEQVLKFSNNNMVIKLPTWYEMKQIKKNHLLFDTNLKINFKNYHIEVSDKEEKEYVKYFKISQMDTYLDLGFLKDFQDLISEYDFLVQIHALTYQENDYIADGIIKGLDKWKNNKINRRSFFKRKEAEQNELDLEEQIRETVSQRERFFGMSQMFKIHASNQKELKSKIKKIKREIKRIGYDFSFLNSEQDLAFFDFHQGYENNFINRIDKNWFKFLISKKKWAFIDENIFWLPSSTIAFGLPFYEYHFLQKNAYYLGTNDLYQPVAIDFSKNQPTKHEAIIGISGAGKTTIQELKLKMKILDKNEILYLIDPKGEYSDLVKKNQGQVIQVDKGFINPFSFDKNSNLEFKKNFLENFLNVLLGKDIIKNKAVLDLLLNIVFKSKEYFENKFNFDLFYQLINKNLDLKKLLDSKEIEALIIAIERFSSKGINKGLFAQNLDIKPETRLISFNFNGLLASTQSSSMAQIIKYAVMDYILNKMLENGAIYTQNKKNINLWLDEFSTLILNDDTYMIYQLTNIYNLARSYSLTNSIIFQNFQVLKEPRVKHLVSSILANTSYFHLLGMNNEDINILKELADGSINLNDEDIAFLNRKEKHASLSIVNNFKSIIYWDWLINYEENRDKDDDNNKALRINRFLEIEKNIIESLQNVYDGVKDLGEDNVEL